MFDSRFLPLAHEVITAFQGGQKTITPEQRDILVNGLEEVILDPNSLGEYLFSIKSTTNLANLIPTSWINDFLQKIDAEVDESIGIVIEEGVGALDDLNVLQLIMEPADLCHICHLTKHWLDDSDDGQEPPSVYWTNLLGQRSETTLEEESVTEDWISPFTDEFKDFLSIFAPVYHDERRVPRLEDHERDVVLCALEGILVDVSFVFEYLQHLKNAHDLRAPFRFTDPETDRTSTILQTGLRCLDNEQLAELMFNPFQLRALMDVLHDTPPSSYWLPIFKLYNPDMKLVHQAFGPARVPAEVGS